MEGEKSSGVGVGPPISIGRLVLMLSTVGQQYLFLQQHDIIPSTGVCHKCHQVILGSPIVKGNERFWNCKKCKAVTTTRFGTMLYKSKMKLDLDPSCFLLHRTKQDQAVATSIRSLQLQPK